MKYLSHLLLAVLFILVSCQVKLPEGIIQPDRMESLLYDYHMVQALSSEANASAEYHKKLYHEYIFKKHGVDKALFDSSLVWYTRHPAYMTQIYANLQERLDNELAIMQDERAVAQKSKQVDVDVNADTLELWTGKEVQRLTSSAMNNLLNFSYSSDSAFVAGDSVVLTLNTRFFTEKPREQKIVAAIVIKYEDNSVTSKVEEIESSGIFALQSARDYDKTIKGVNGFIYYSDTDSTATSGTILSGLSLRRIHPPVIEEDE